MLSPEASAARGRKIELGESAGRSDFSPAVVSVSVLQQGPAITPIHLGRANEGFLTALDFPMIHFFLRLLYRVTVQ